MDEEMSVSLQDELIADLTEELSGQPTFSTSVITQKVVNAIKEVKRARRYPAYYTDEQINTDLQEYYANIRNIALYDFAQIGAPFQSSHNENSVNRVFGNRNSLFSGILPIARI